MIVKQKASHLQMSLRLDFQGWLKLLEGVFGNQHEFLRIFDLDIALCILFLNMNAIFSHYLGMKKMSISWKPRPDFPTLRMG